jgi:hypothetical protein
MSEPLARALLVALAVAVAPAAAAEPEAAIDERHLALLAATDLFATAPAELRLELEVGAEGGTRLSALEIWRRGPERALVRFLDPKERGKFVLRDGRETWFLAPGAKPVRIGSALRRQGGAALDELLGLSLARDYRIRAVAETGGVATFDLEARAATAAYPEVRWAVDVARRRPLRAELGARGGRTLRVIEFRAWLDAARLVPGVVAIADVARGGAKLVARFRAVEARPVDLALFALDDPTARAALPPP